MMKKRISFEIVDATGWEDGYSPKELTVHSPLVKGWRSERYCLYPQELILKLSTFSRISILQILSHQYLISKRIEILSGSVRHGRPAALAHVTFKRLGFVSLGDNQENGHRSRELKSIPLNVKCQFVKLLLHQNHINHLNVFNQVGLVAVNVIGERVEPSGSGQVQPHPLQDVETQERIVHSYLPGYHGNKASVAGGEIPLMDDLAFSVYQDSITAKIIRHLQDIKLTAVEREQFNEAKLLKQAIVDLQKVGEVLGQFEVEKRRAVEREDFDLAKQKKDYCDSLRRHVYHQLNLHQLIQDPSLLQGVSFHSPNKPPPADPEPSKSPLGEPPQLSVIESPKKQEHHVKPSVTMVTIEDERPLPALLKRSDEVIGVNDPSGVSDQSGRDLLPPEPLGEQAQNESSLAIQEFGMELVKLVYSKQFHHRESALNSLSERICSLNIQNKKDLQTELKALKQLLYRLLNDKVFSVFQSSCNLLKYLTTDFVTKHSKYFEDFEGFVTSVVSKLLTRLGDHTHRIAQHSQGVIVDILSLERIKHVSNVFEVITENFSKPLPHWKIVKGRLELINDLLKKNLIEPQLFNRIIKLLSICMVHSHKEVRERAVQLTFDLYKLTPAEVRRELPPDTAALRKSVLWKTVMEGLDKIDGKPTVSMDSKKEEEKAKVEELNALKNEVQHLRKMAAEQGKIPSRTPTVATSALAVDSKSVRFKSPTISLNSRTSHDLATTDNQNSCVFCGLSDPSFTASTLETHYITSCAMLHQCSYCREVVEIPQLQVHWMAECTEKKKFRKCLCCKEPIHVSQFQKHVSAKKCSSTYRAPPSNMKWCALCSKSVLNDEASWRKHIMAPKGCHGNKRF